jgi:hypothetical protein
MPPNTNERKEHYVTKLNNDAAPKSGQGSESDRLSQSPQSIRRGGAEYTDVDSSPVQTNAGQLNYDKNDLPMGVEPPACGPSQ